MLDIHSEITQPEICLPEEALREVIILEFTKYMDFHHSIWRDIDEDTDRYTFNSPEYRNMIEGYFEIVSILGNKIDTDCYKIDSRVEIETDHEEMFIPEEELTFDSITLLGILEQLRPLNKEQLISSITEIRQFISKENLNS